MAADIREVCFCEKIVAAKPFDKGVLEGAEVATRRFTALVLRESTYGKLRTLEVRGEFVLSDFPESLRYEDREEDR